MQIYVLKYINCLPDGAINIAVQVGIDKDRKCCKTCPQIRYGAISTHQL